MARKRPGKRSTSRTSKPRRPLRTGKRGAKRSRPASGTSRTASARKARASQKARRARPKATARRKSAKTAARASRPAAARKRERQAAARKKRTASKRVVQKRATRKRPTQKRAVKKQAARKRVVQKRAAPKRRAPKTPATTTSSTAVLQRERRRLSDDERLAASPSESDTRLMSSARTGHSELKELLEQHTETSPRLTAGDLDAKWEDAYAVGDEAPGGDNPTPDQDRVDDIGRALGVVYQDDEELKGSDKITERDRHRWEFDPASSDDWPHDKDQD